MSNKKYFRSGLIMAGLWSLLVSIGCDKTDKTESETEVVNKPEDVANKVEKAWELAKGLEAKPENILEIKNLVSSFKADAEKQKELLELEDNGATFLNYIAAGKASPSSAEVLKEVFSWNDDLRQKQLAGRKNSQDSIEQLSSARPEGEKLEDRCKVVATILPYSGIAQLNKFKTGGAFDTLFSSCVVKELPQDRAEDALANLEKPNFDALVEYVASNPAEATTFKRIYDIAKDADKQKALHNKILEKAYVAGSEKLLAFLNALDNLGLSSKIKENVWTLKNLKGKAHTGNLWQVLATALWEDKGADRPSIADIARVVHGKWGDDAAWVAVNETPYNATTLLAMVGGGRNGKILLDMTNFSAGDIMAELKRIVALPAADEVEQNKIKQMVNSLRTPAEATNLANEDFVPYLTQLKSSPVVAEILQNFLTKLGTDAGKKAAVIKVLPATPAGPFANKNALQVLLTRDPARYAGEDEPARDAMIYDIVKAGGKEALSKVTNPAEFKHVLNVVAQKADPIALNNIFTSLDPSKDADKPLVKALLDWSVQNIALAQPAFLALYNLAPNATKKEALANALVNAAYAIPDSVARGRALKSLVDEPGFGLRKSIVDGNDFLISPAAGQAAIGKLPLIDALRARAMQDATVTAGPNQFKSLDALREFAKALSLAYPTPEAYQDFINDKGGILGIGTKPSIVEKLGNQLRALPNKSRSGYERFYLADNDNLVPFEVAGVPATQVSNAQLKQLYREIVIDSPNAQVNAEALAKAGNDKNDSFLHRLLERPLDADIQEIFNDLIPRLAASTDAGAQLERQLALQKGGAAGARFTPVQKLTRAATGVPGSPAETAKLAMLGALYQADKGTAAIDMLPEQLKARVVWDFAQDGTLGQDDFKKVYGKITEARDNATTPGAKGNFELKLKDMRSTLLAQAFIGIDAEVLAKMNKFFGFDAAGDVYNDVWGLHQGMFSDDYDLPGRVAGTVYAGRIAKVLAERAVADNAATLAAAIAAPAPVDVLAIYSLLNNQNKALKAIMVKPGQLAAHMVLPAAQTAASTGNASITRALAAAANPRDGARKLPVDAASALGLLRVGLGVNLPGYAEKLTGVLNPLLGIQGVDELLLPQIFFAEKIKNSELDGFMNDLLVNNEGAQILAAYRTPAGANHTFLALLPLRAYSEVTRDALKRYLDQLPDAPLPGKMTKEQVVNMPIDNTGAITPLSLFATNPRAFNALANQPADDPKALAGILQMLVESSNQATVQALTDPQLEFVLNSLFGHRDVDTLDIMEGLLSKLTANQLAAVAVRWIWTATRNALIAGNKQDDISFVASLFRAELERLKAGATAAEKNQVIDMRSGLIYYAWIDPILAAPAGENTQAKALRLVRSVIQVVNNDFFTAEDLITNDWSPFRAGILNPGFSAKLLYQILFAARAVGANKGVAWNENGSVFGTTYLPQEAVREIATAMKAKSGLDQARWDRYLDELIVVPPAAPVQNTQINGILVYPFLNPDPASGVIMDRDAIRKAKARELLQHSVVP